MSRPSVMPVLMGAVLVDMIGFGIVLPLLPFYAESFGATPLQVTVLIASYSAMQLAAAPVWGRISDRIGRRPLLIAGLFASAVSYLIFGLAGSLAVLFLSRMAGGAAGGIVPVAQAYVADTTTAADRARGMGLIGAAAGVGIMLGPAIGGFFSQWGLGAPGFVAAGMCAVNGVAALILLPESRPRRGRSDASVPSLARLRDWASSFTRPPLSLLVGVYFLAISSFAAMTSVLALFLDRSFGLDARDMGYVFALAGMATVVVRGLLLGRLVVRFGEPATARLGTVALAASFFLLPVMPVAGWLLLAVPLYALGAGILFPTLASLVSQSTDHDSQGSILGGSQLVGGVGRVLGPIWAGYLFQHVGIASPFWLGLTLVALAGWLALRISSPDAVAAPAPAPVAGAHDVA